MSKEIVKPGTGWEEPEAGDKVRGAFLRAELCTCCLLPPTPLL